MRRLLLLTCLLAAPLLASPTQADIAKPATVDQTLALMLDHLRTDFPDAAIDTAAQNITLDRDGQSVVNPDNLHAVLQTIDDGATREAELVRFITVIKTSLAENTNAERIPLELVHPVLRHEDFITTQGDAATGAGVYAQPFLGDMVLVYAIDYPDHVAYITQAHLDTGQVSPIRLKQEADLNLSQKLDQIQFQQQNGTFMLAIDGFYESSTVLDAALWADVSRQVGDDLVMVVPARDLVMFTAASNDEGRAFLAEARDNILANGTHQLSDHMYLWQNGHWQVFAN